MFHASGMNVLCQKISPSSQIFFSRHLRFKRMLDLFLQLQQISQTVHLGYLGYVFLVDENNNQSQKLWFMSISMKIVIQLETVIWPLLMCSAKLPSSSKIPSQSPFPCMRGSDLIYETWWSLWSCGETRLDGPVPGKHYCWVIRNKIARGLQKAGACTHHAYSRGVQKRSETLTHRFPFTTEFQCCPPSSRNTDKSVFGQACQSYNLALFFLIQEF